MSALAGKRVVVTRAEHQATELAEILEEVGATALRCPTIAVGPPDSWTDLDEALGRLDEYRWVVFTSSNGVRAVVSRLADSGAPARLRAARVAAVGSSTAGSLAESLPEVAGSRILLARADIADPAVARTLRERGAERVDDVAAYRTSLLAPSGDALEELRRGVDGITFTSPSTVRGFLELGKESKAVIDGVVVATLGPAAADFARRMGIDVTAEARTRSMSGLVDALETAFGTVEPRRRGE
ncbi:MAG: uroporphyrinogen-III synthase [Gemmatimonadota bacterium]